MENLNKISIGSRRSVSPQEVVLMRADENYTLIHFLDGRKMIVAVTLKELEKRFVNCGLFFRTHKSYLINLTFLAQHHLTSDKHFVRMKHNHEAILSRRKRSSFLKTLSSLQDSTRISNL